MFKVIAVYRVPTDEAAKTKFEDHYKNIHTPICLKVPGILEVRTNKIFGGPTGASNLSMVTEMCFENKDAWKAAMKTAEISPFAAKKFCMIHKMDSSRITAR